MRFSIFGFEAPSPNPPILHRNKTIGTGRDYAKAHFDDSLGWQAEGRGKRCVSQSAIHGVSLWSSGLLFFSGCLMFAGKEPLMIIG